METENEASMTRSEGTHPGKLGATREQIMAIRGLRLTTWLASDLPDLQRLHGDPQVMKYMNAGPQRDQAYSWDRLNRWQHEHELRAWSRWRIEDAAGRFAGRAGFGVAHHTFHRELGYVLAPAYWGQGHATTLVGALTQWHFDHPEPKLRRGLRAYVLAENLASQRVLEKCGFTRVGADVGAEHELVYENTRCPSPTEP